MDRESFRRLHPDAFHRKFLEEGLRFDGRSKDQRRPVNLSINVVSTAEGSASVRMGDTQVIATVKAEVAVVENADEDCGNVVFTVQTGLLQPTLGNSSRIEEDALICSRLTNIFVENGIVDCKSLLIESGRARWILYVDVISLNDAGNLFDACMLAVDAALHSTKLPAVTISDAGEATGDPLLTSPVKLTSHVVSTSFLRVVDSHFMLDPSLEEEEVGSFRISIIVNDQESLSGLFQESYSPGKVTTITSSDAKLSQEQLSELVFIAASGSKQVFSVLNKNIQPLS